MLSRPTRPALRYHGGKWRIAPRIIAHFPPHDTYVEPFGGAASVLLRKPRSHGEVYNDLDDAVVNFFRVLRDPPSAAEFERRVRLIPFARAEFVAAYAHGGDAIDEAVRMAVRSFMGFGSAAMTRTHKTGFRSNASRNGTTPAVDWANWPAQVALLTERLRGVVIEHRDAAEVLRQHDRPGTLHYVDPPYPHSTRSSMRDGNRLGAKHAYRHEMSDEDHRALAEVLRGLRGMVVLSGYPCALYDEELYPDWRRVDMPTHADGAKPRVERLWLNPACAEALDVVDPLFAEAACP